MSSDPRLDPSAGFLVRAAARAAAALLPLREARPPAPAEIRRVLVVRTDERVGNALLTVPLARALTRLLPAAEVDLLLARRAAKVAEGISGMRVVPFEKRDFCLRPLRFLRSLFALRRAGYDAVIDAAHWHSFSLTSALVSRWAARRWLVGSERGPSFLYSAAVPPPPAGLPEAQAKLELLRGLSIAPPDPAPSLETPLGTLPSDRARAVLRELRTPFVALNPGARKRDHRASPSRFGALARALHEAHGVRSFVLWGPRERPLAEAVAAAAGPCALVAPPTDLNELAAIFRSAAIVVTNDTGPMHLAVACGSPVLALFLSEEAMRFAHPGPRFAGVVCVSDADVGVAAAAAARLLDSAGIAAEPARTREAPS